jgi:cold shock CspA family protein
MPTGLIKAYRPRAWSDGFLYLVESYAFLGIMTSTRKTGTIKIWKDDRGYGFLRTEDRRDIFVHISHWVENEAPRKGDRVSFTEDVGRDQRTFARQVTRVGGDPA